MIWPFRRKLKPEQERPPLNEDWAPGDLAYCTKSFAPAPLADTLCRVTGVEPGYLRDSIQPAWGLELSGLPALYDARAFRKVHPDSELCSLEFKLLIDRIARAPRKETVR